MELTVHPIGTVRCNETGFCVVLEPEYREALTGLDGFGYVQVLWWFDQCDDPQSRATRTITRPYVNGPEVMGVFATRSPERPNPIAVSACYVTYIDEAQGIVHLAWIDAIDGTPVLDIKPYTPSADRVEQPSVPEWCAHWPHNVEDSGAFDWESEFNF